MTPETGDEINWPLWIGFALVGLVANLVYARLFEVPWTPPEHARFVDERASVTVSSLLHSSYTWGTAVWVTDQELGSLALHVPVPLSSIKSIRMTQWFMRKTPVIVVECEDGREVQLGVQDWRALNAVLVAGSTKAVVGNGVEA